MQKILAGLIILFIVQGSTAFAAEKASVEQVTHLLERTSFGIAPGDIEYVQKIGLDAYLQKQLDPARLKYPPRLSQELAQLHTLSMDAPQLLQQFTLEKDKNHKPTPAENKAIRQQGKIVVAELIAAKTLRAIESPAQLQEVMTDFWYNHFNVFSGKGMDRLLVGVYERDAIRPHVFGKFRDLLMATAKHPAMLVYLDNIRNVAPKTNARGKLVGINENYAREIMELHTLGVDNGYTQADVTSLAHILTGWGVSKGKDRSQNGDFKFNPKEHDWSIKNFLGQRINARGEGEIEEAINILARHPATATHISYKLAQYFVSDEPSKELVAQLANIFSKSDGDISAVLQEILRSDEFWAAKSYNAKFKPPFRYLISIYRAAGIVPNNLKLFRSDLQQMGQVPYHFLTPNGYANTKDIWLNSDALLKRMEKSKILVQQTKISAPALLDVFSSGFSANTIAAINEAGGNNGAVLLLNSPEFLYY